MTQITRPKTLLAAVAAVSAMGLAACDYSKLPDQGHIPQPSPIAQPSSSVGADTLPTSVPSVTLTPTAEPTSTLVPSPSPCNTDATDVPRPTSSAGCGGSMQPMPSTSPTPLPILLPSFPDWQPPTPKPTIPEVPIPTHQPSPSPIAGLIRFEPAQPVSWCPTEDNYDPQATYQTGQLVIYQQAIYRASYRVSPYLDFLPGQEDSGLSGQPSNPWQWLEPVTDDWCAGLAVDVQGNLMELGGWPFVSNRGLPVDLAASQHRLSAYYPGYAIYYGREFLLEHVPFESIDDLFYSDVQVSDQGIVLQDDWGMIERIFAGDNFYTHLRGNFGQLTRAKVVHDDQRIHLQIGTPGLSEALATVIATEEARVGFAQGVRQFFNQYALTFDGLHLDWQYPEDHWSLVCGGNAECEQQHRHEDATNILLLMAQLQREMDLWQQEFNRPFYLSLTVGERQAERLHAADLDWPALMPLVDQVHLWALDYAKGSDSQPVHHSSIRAAAPGEQSAEGLVTKALALGADPSKLMLSVASHAVGWQGVSSPEADPFAGLAEAPFGRSPNCHGYALLPCGQVEDGMITSAKVYFSYRSDGQIDLGWLESQLIPRISLDWQFVEDTVLGRSYLWQPELGQLISFESPDLVLAKGDLIREHQLQGLFLTDIAASSFGTVNVSNAALRRR